MRVHVSIHIIEICRPPKKHARNEYARVQVPETPLTLSLCASENLMNHGYKKCVKQFLKNSLKSGILDQNCSEIRQSSRNLDRTRSGGERSGYRTGPGPGQPVRSGGPDWRSGRTLQWTNLENCFQNDLYMFSVIRVFLNYWFEK